MDNNYINYYNQQIFYQTYYTFHILEYKNFFDKTSSLPIFLKKFKHNDINLNYLNINKKNIDLKFIKYYYQLKDESQFEIYQFIIKNYYNSNNKNNDINNKYINESINIFQIKEYLDLYNFSIDKNNILLKENHIVQELKNFNYSNQEEIIKLNNKVNSYAQIFKININDLCKLNKFNKINDAVNFKKNILLNSTNNENMSLIIEFFQYIYSKSYLLNHLDLNQNKDINLNEEHQELNLNTIYIFQYIMKNNKFIEQLFQLDDFKFELIKNKLPNYLDNEKKNLIQYYIQDFHNINIIISEKLFYLLYPKFDINFFIFFNDIKNTDKIPLYIFNYYHSNNYLIECEEKFYQNYPSFDLNFFKDYYYYLNFHNKIDYLKYYHKYKDDVLYINEEDFLHKNINFDLNIFNYFQEKIFDLGPNYSYLRLYSYLIYNKKKNIYSIQQYLNENSNFDIEFYKKYYELDYLNESEIIIYWEKIGK